MTEEEIRAIVRDEIAAAGVPVTRENILEELEAARQNAMKAKLAAQEAEGAE